MGTVAGATVIALSGSNPAPLIATYFSILSDAQNRAAVFAAIMTFAILSGCSR